MSTNPEYTRVYDYKMEITRLRTICSEAERYTGLSISIDNISDPIEVEGIIGAIDGDVDGKLGFPTFTIESNSQKSLWERKSHRSPIGSYPMDKKFMTGKKVRLSYAIDLSTNQNSSEPHKWILYIDIED